MYDGAGNLTQWHDLDGGTVTSYAYYPWGQMRSLSRAGFERQYATTADGQRIVTRDPGTGRLTVTLRGLDTKVRRVVEHESEKWTWVKDYVTRGGLQVGSVDNAGDVQHFYLDHLGSIRQISTGEGRHAAFHTYFPFGEAAPPITPDGEAMKFTGHERDFNGSTTATMHHLDYMHARYYNPNLGRFLSADPHDLLREQFGTTEEQRDFLQFLAEPQSWNRYAYVKGNPLKYIDPDGEAAQAVVAIEVFFSGKWTAAGSGFVATGATPVLMAAGAGIAVGYAVNQIPGVSEALTHQGLSNLLTNVFFGGKANDARSFISTKVSTALRHIATYPSPPPDDPNERSRLKNVYERMKSHLRDARKELKNLRGKSREEYDRLIRATESALDKWWNAT